MRTSQDVHALAEESLHDFLEVGNPDGELEATAGIRTAYMRRGNKLVRLGGDEEVHNQVVEFDGAGGIVFEDNGHCKDRGVEGFGGTEVFDEETDGRDFGERVGSGRYGFHYGID